MLIYVKLVEISIFSSVFIRVVNAYGCGAGVGCGAGSGSGAGVTPFLKGSRFLSFFITEIPSRKFRDEKIRENYETSKRNRNKVRIYNLFNQMAKKQWAQKPIH